MRRLSAVAPDWWDYTTLDSELLEDAAKLTEKTLLKLSRPGFHIHYYETLEDFYLAEALEYIDAWRRSTSDSRLHSESAGDDRVAIPRRAPRGG